MDEIRQAVNIAVSLILASSVIFMMNNAIDTGAELSNVKNEFNMTTQCISEYNRFNKYNTNGNSTLYGDDIIEAVMMFASDGIEIVVANKTVETYRVNKQKINTNPSLIKWTYLKEIFKSNVSYTANIVYDGVNPITINPTTITNGGKITGLIFRIK